MNLIAIAFLVFVCLTAASLGCLLFHERLQPQHRQDDTQSVIRLVANIFVVMTSLVLGLMTNTAKNRFDSINRDVHIFATDLILLDRTLQTYGEGAGEAQRRLIAYVDRAANSKWTSSDPLLVSDEASEQLLDDVGRSVQDITPTDEQQLAVWNDARQEYRKIVQKRWALLEQSEGSIPTPLLGMVVTWLVLVFGSFGYRAPRNAVVVTSFLVAAALMSGTLYLILETDEPFAGPISISHAPLHRVLAEMRR
jgi:Protein of unknown function (DUF4239)